MRTFVSYEHNQTMQDSTTKEVALMMMMIAQLVKCAEE